MTTAQLAPQPVFQAFGPNGLPLSGGKLYSYAAGTSTPQATYPSQSEVTPNTNPIILSAFGTANVWLDPGLSYKLNLTDANGNQIPGWPVDNIQGALTVTVGNLVPSANNTYTLGSPSEGWAQLYLGASSAPAYNSTFNTVGYYGQSAAEVSAAVTPTEPVFPSSQSGLVMSVWRFFSAAQIASCIAEDGLVDMTSAIQAANDFLEGNITSGIGGQPHPGGKLFFPAGAYNFSSNIRVGAQVIWEGAEYWNTILNFTSSSYTGFAISMGPAEGGFFGYNNIYTIGSAITDMRISLPVNNQLAVVIDAVGAAQFSYLKRIEIDGINQYGINLTGVGGPAYFYAEDIQLGAGTSSGLTDREGFRISMGGGYCKLDNIVIQGGGSFPFNICIRASNDSSNGANLLVKNIHTENATTGIYFDTGGTNATSVVEGYSGNASTGTLISIPASYTGTVTCIAINGLTGSAGQPIAIANANTGESFTNAMIGIYSWSGTPGIQAGSFAGSLLQNHLSSHVSAYAAGAQTFTNNSETTVQYNTVTNDFLGEWNTSTYVYTAKFTGYMKVYAIANMQSASWSSPPAAYYMAIRKNGSIVAINKQPVVAAVTESPSIDCSASLLVAIGDTIDIRLFQNSGGTLTITNAASNSYVNIDRMV